MKFQSPPLYWDDSFIGEYLILAHKTKTVSKGDTPQGLSEKYAAVNWSKTAWFQL